MHARNFMSDIFISYAHSDGARAQNLAKALEQHGWSVWWDPQIPPGKTFDEVIEKALNAALRLRVSGNMYCDGTIPQWTADWRLRVKINGVDLGSYIIDGGWCFIDFPLYSYYNKWVTINILCEATGWYFEHVLIDDIDFIQAQ